DLQVLKWYPLLNMEIFGPISGAHVNPAVSIAHLIINKPSILEIVVYIVAQLIGGVSGYGLLMVITPTKYYNVSGHCLNLPHTELKDWQAVAAEFLMTFVMLLAVCATWDKRNAKIQDSVSLRIGLLVATLNMIGGTYTSTSMNPARSFGPAIWKGDLRHHWIYWVGPLLGSIVASLFYKYVLMRFE
ncbi:unnamed protein product, partial [Brassicogethes aeneus]